MSDVTSCSQSGEITNFSNGITRQRASGDAPCSKKLTESELNELASQQAASTADLVIRLINYEFQNLRLKVKNGGIWFRTFVSRQMDTLSPKLYRFSRRMLTIFVEQSRDRCLEGNAAIDAAYVASMKEEEPIKLSTITFNDVAEVLTADEAVDGITFAYTFRCPAWEALPERVKPLLDEDDEENRFQLFNRPMSMTMTMDDDECRMSRASSVTRFTTNADVDKLKSVESQLAMLSQQIQLLLQSKSNIAASIDTSMMIDDQSSSPAVSDDEGRGPSLYSPPSKRKRTKASALSSPEQPVLLPPVAPPPGCPPPPPPPPPADLMTRGVPSLARNDSQESLILNKLPPCDENKVPDSPSSQREVSVRPSVHDLRTVTLRRTGNNKSPGGTPMPKSRINTSRDQGGYLANALREKFRHVNNSFSEQEDEPSSGWVDEE